MAILLLFCCCIPCHNFVYATVESRIHTRTLTTKCTGYLLLHLWIKMLFVLGKISTVKLILRTNIRKRLNTAADGLFQLMNLNRSDPGQ